MDRDILEVGSHTRNHPNCVNLVSRDEFESELKGSQQDIEKQIGYPVKNFCYPAGSYDDRVINFVKEHYSSACTIVPGFNDLNTPLFELRRISTDENTGLFKSMVSGSYFFVSRLLRRIKGKA